MARKDDKQVSLTHVSKIVRRHLRVTENMRFLRRMPQFALDKEAPQGFDDLLHRLDMAQRKSR